MPHKGFVYILSNPSMPGLVKIGKTHRGGDHRAKELYQTWVPTPFELVDEVLSPDCGQLELWMHEKLHDYRISDAREFFKMEERSAVQELEDQLRYQVESWLENFIPDHTIVHNSEFFDISNLANATRGAGVHPIVAQDAIRFLTAEEFRPALDRHDEWQMNNRRKLTDAITCPAENIVPIKVAK